MAESSQTSRPTDASRFRVLITDRAWPDCDLERGILNPIGAEIVEAADQDEATLANLAQDVDAIATCWAQMTAAVIRAATKCRVISRFGIGLDNISVETATELNIPVTYVPDYCVDEVSDHALAMLLACARKIAFYHLHTMRGEYDLQAGHSLRRLRGQTLGLIGLGRIARSLLPKARALGLDVIAYTPSGNDYDTRCRMVSFAELLKSSDFVSLHLPLSNASHQIIGGAEFAQMRSTAFLINTSRGSLIDHAALQRALEHNELAGAALDVFDPEPPDLSQPLFRDERVLVTPHAGFLSVESLHELRTRTARQIADALQGLQPENVVNPQVFDPSA